MMQPSAPTPDNIDRAVALLRAGELVALPTETVYGLGADAASPQAVARIFAAKGRPADHPLIVHLPDAEHLPRWARSIPKEALALARAFWPGPLTLILKREEGVPDAVTGGQDTVGVRVPGHPVALQLLRAFDSGIAAPSANRFGRISPTTARHVIEELDNRVAMVLDGGPCEVGIESTILDLSSGSPRILRPGAIGAAQIAAVIGREPLLRETGGTAGADKASGSLQAATLPRVSGSLAAHYAPRTPMQLLGAPALSEAVLDAARAGRRLAVLAFAPPDPSVADWQCAPRDPAQYAHDLYASLRRLDALGADLILVEAPPHDSAWAAVADRLGRAAVGAGRD